MIHLALDIDGILADFVGGFNLLATELHKKPMPPEWRSWNIEQSTGLTPEEVSAVWHHISRHAFWAHLPIVQKNALAIQRLQAMQRHGLAMVTFITSRKIKHQTPATIYIQTFDWLTEIGFKRPNLIMSSHKGDVVAALRTVTGFFDDHFEFCRSVKMLCPSVLVGLQDEPHQLPGERQLADVWGIQRFHSLNGFLDAAETSPR